MTIDERAIEAFMNSHSKDWHQYKSVSFAFKIDDIVRCLEAYEAAKWRPIEEAPRDTDILIADQDGCYRFARIIKDHVVEEGGWGGRMNRYFAARYVFLTINPPPQK